jgi:hypothetical protein
MIHVDLKARRIELDDTGDPELNRKEIYLASKISGSEGMPMRFRMPYSLAALPLKESAPSANASEESAP